MADPYIQSFVRDTSRIAQNYTPAEISQFGGLLTGAGGIADLLGYYPVTPDRDTTFTEMVRGPKGPSFFENIRNQDYLDAAVQSLGAIPLVGIARAAKPAISRGATEEGVAQIFRRKHSSPHSFEQFKLDETTIKTGEGANVQGQGVFLSDPTAAEVDEYYRQMARMKAERQVPAEGSMAAELEAQFGFGDMRPTDPQFSQKGSMAAEYGTDDPRETFSAYVDEMIGSSGEIGQQSPEVTRMFGRDNQTRLEFEDGSAYAIRFNKEGNAARMIPMGDAKAYGYDVDVEVDPNLLADYDAPLIKQSQNVKNAIIDVVDESLDTLPKERLVNFGLGVLKKEEVAEEFGVPSQVNEKLKNALVDMPIEDLRGGLKQSLLDQEKTFEELSQAFNVGFEVENILSIELAKKGIKGAQYNDKLSRTAKTGQTKNMVVYDPAIISIAKQYKLAVPLAAAVGAGTLTPEQAIAQQRTDTISEKGIGTLDMDKPTTKTSQDTERKNAFLSKQLRDAGVPVESFTGAREIEPKVLAQLEDILDSSTDSTV
jgi:hypothetical protein